jgi:hypothetical protein
MIGMRVAVKRMLDIGTAPVGLLSGRGTGMAAS